MGKAKKNLERESDMNIDQRNLEGGINTGERYLHCKPKKPGQGENLLREKPR